MDNFKVYNWLLIGLLSSLAVPVLGMLMLMEPRDGELTRMGGYLESDFGWQLPQLEFDEPLFVRATTLREYDRYFDVVVFGDSFSDDVSRGWQNHLVSETGLSLISFNMNEVDFADLLATPTFKSLPPRIFVYESVERSIVSRHSRCTADDKIVSPDLSIDVISTTALDSSVVSRNRGTGMLLRQSADPSPVLNYWYKAFFRTVLERNVTEVKEFELEKAGLFSNKESKRLLVISRDFKLQGVNSMQIQIAQCRLRELQNLVQENGRTAFSVLVFPDKTSIYAEYIEDEEFVEFSVLSEFESTRGLNIVKTRNRFSAAVNDGVVDLYLPNDTHCGYSGYQLAATALVESMLEWGWIEPGSATD